MCIPDMENHRQLHLPGQIQLIDEPDMLLQPLLLLTPVVIVQTDFANGNHTGRSSIIVQLPSVRPSNLPTEDELRAIYEKDPLFAHFDSIFLGYQKKIDLLTAKGFV